ncbi:MAG: glycosyltransferase family 39 protein, partial [Thermoguttaceae bacterium]
MGDGSIPTKPSPSFPDDWSEDRGDRLFAEGQPSNVGPPKAVVVVGLLMLCLIPRLWAGTLHDIICPDAVSYIEWTDKLEKGDWAGAFQYTGVCIYQPLLLGLKQLPGDWLITAKWWSVAMATLAILPIYGWIRRQFNETLAILGSGFYALHPSMVHDSPLMVRDPTFWLLFGLGLYCGWRAVSELKFRWFAAFALTFALAIHLRTEGWLLAPVLVVWLVFRLRRVSKRRTGIVLAATLACSIGPVAGMVTQRVLYAQGELRVTGNLRHLKRIESLVSSVCARQVVNAGPVTTASPTKPAIAGPAAPVSTLAHGTTGMVVRYGKSFGYLQLGFVAIGLVHWRRRLSEPSKGALLVFCLLSVGAVWACFCHGEMDRRYAFPCIMVSLPTISAGLCVSGVLFDRYTNRSKENCDGDSNVWFFRMVVGSAIFLSLAIVTSPRPLLYDQSEMGNWIRSNLKPGQRLAVNIEETRLLEYYAGATICLRLPREGFTYPEHEQSSLRDSHPSSILIWIDWRNPAGRRPFERMIVRTKELGYREVPTEELPEK